MRKKGQAGRRSVRAAGLQQGAVQDGSQVVWGVQLGGAGASSMLPTASSGQRIV